MARFIILMYHMISEPRSERERRYACPPTRFAKHMRFLRSQGFNLVSLEAVGRYLRGKESLPERSVAVTLDDGFRDNYDNAFPILREYTIPATVFLTAGMVKKANTRMKARDFPRREMLTWREVEVMAHAGIFFGAHTMRHPRLTELAIKEAVEEISQSKKVIEDRLGRVVDSFAYPYGLFTDETRALVQEAGYALACSTRSGFNKRNTDPYVLRRIEVYGTDILWKLQQKIIFGTNEASVAFPLKYYWNRLKACLV
ncbi:MAG: polysaccharide deacetylase family protein [Deltaproteobacteria bacterium]|nr:polysaccharide deacetylase family protein [Deltaproteobacteria bacterium]